MKTARHVSWAIALLTGCGSAGPTAPPPGPGDPDGDLDRLAAGGERRSAVLIVTNPTGDPRGSIAPHAEVRLVERARGRRALVATNARLGLSQRVRPNRIAEGICGAGDPPRVDPAAP